MEISVREIDRSNWFACTQLSVDDAQKNFVASNAFSLAQAAYEPETYPLAIYRGEEMVGFIMYGFDSELNYWGMWRLMIDKRFQKQRIGETAVRMLLELVTEKLGHVKFYTSAEPENAIAIGLYEKLGFCRTGKLVEDEAELVIQL